MRYKKLTPKQLKLLKRYWALLQIEFNNFYGRVNDIESQMKENPELGIKDVEFFWVDEHIVGIGNESKTIKLLQQEELA